MEIKPSLSEIHLYSKISPSISLPEPLKKIFWPSSIVIDEVAGMFVALAFVPHTALAYFGAFVLFRLFDIFKIFPANYIDKNLKNGYGVIMDDIIAGIYTILTLVILNVFI